MDALRFYEETRQDLEDQALEEPVAQRRLNSLPIFKASGKFIRYFECATGSCSAFLVPKAMPGP
jgi:hypothetical protein